MEIIDWITHAYNINFEQLCLYSSSEESTIIHKEDGELKIIEDDIKYSDSDLERFIPIKLIANQEKRYAEFYVTIPADLSKADEIDILKVLGHMNQKAGPFSTYFDYEVKNIKIYSYVGYSGSFAIEDPNESAQFETRAFSDILLYAMNHAHYWADKIQLLENPDFVAEDVFKLIKKKVKFELVK